MRKKNIFIQLLVIVGFIININTVVFAGDISLPSSPSFFSFEKYHVVGEEYHDKSSQKNVRVEVKNTSNQPLSDVNLFIDSCPDFATCSENILKIGNILPGESVISDDYIEISIHDDMESHMELIWRVECKVGEQFVMDEVLVVETLNE